MNQQYRPQGFRILPPLIKNLLIINGIFFLATLALERYGIDLSDYLGLHYIGSDDFQPYQFITYMFMHSTLSFWHILGNMFALWMFGSAIENVWGPKRFLIFYMVTGIGAAVIQMIIMYIRVSMIEAQLTPEAVNMVYSQGLEVLSRDMNYTNVLLAKLNIMINSTTVGASGAVFGILLAFGMMFPNSLIYVYFAIPVKAKWFVMIYGAFELYAGIAANPGDNVAHFAHLGGMIFGFLLIKYWNKKSNKPKYF
ncbi:MAG: rhomboid family intramembrane serine protease [Saprospiraceae bacterium]|nr:rhomboid family intramembrane serine protease [Saprospiraceae bacterium]